MRHVDVGAHLFAVATEGDRRQLLTCFSRGRGPERRPNDSRLASLRLIWHCRTSSVAGETAAMSSSGDLTAGSSAAFNLSSAFVHLADGGAATVVPVDASFWENMDPRFDHRRMVSIIESTGDWPNWEMHPRGEEMIYLLSGRMTLVLDKASGAVDCGSAPKRDPCLGATKSLRSNDK